MNDMQHMWIAEFIRAGSRAAAFKLLSEITQESVSAPELLSILALAETDRGSAVGIGRALESEGMTFLAWAWWTYAVDGGESLADVVKQGLRIINENMCLPLATHAHCVAHLRVWRELSLSRKKRSPDFTLDIFAVSQESWRDELPDIINDDTRARAAFRPPVSLLWSRQWDEAAVLMAKYTLDFVDPADRRYVPSPHLLLVAARPELREHIRTLVDVLFEIGTNDSGALAIGWMMLLCDPVAPSTFQQCVPQLQELFDQSHMTEPNRAKGQNSLNAWWDAAAGKHVNSKVSIFVIATNAMKKVGDNGFESTREAAMLDPVIDRTKAKARAVPGRSVVVMPSEHGSKLNNYHEAFKPLVDEALPLVIVDDVASIRRRLHMEYPHATVAVDLMLRDLRDGKPFFMKPALLVGSPGSGKSRLIRRLCELVGVFCYRFDGAGSSDNFFAGTSKAWGNTEASVPARAIAQSVSASPLVMIDEIEKAGSHWRAGSLHSAVLPFLERETAGRYRDQSLDWQLDLRHISYAATANSLDGLPAPLRDRFRLIKMPDPTLLHLPQLAANVMHELAAEDELRQHDEPLASDEIEVIGRAWTRAGMSMRKLQKIVLATLEARDIYARRH